MVNTRVAPIIEWLKAENIDFTLITSPTQIFYLTSFNCHPHERFLGLFLFPHTEPLLVCPTLEEDRARQAGWLGEIVACPDGEDPWARIVPALHARRIHMANRIAVEKESLPLSRAEALLHHYPEAKLITAEEALHRSRAQKDATEVETMAAAAQMADEAITIGLSALTEGCTETEIASLIEYEMKKRGADGMAFDTMVLFGEKTGLPHGSPGNRELKAGDMVLFDLGIVHQGYNSDITRTFAYLSCTEEQERIYHTVLTALEAALDLCRPGVRLGELDKVARQVIEDAGYGRYFTHRLGHGLGIEAHEYPSVHGNNDDILQEGMVFTIEPGIYIPDLGGVRIEDDVLITATGYRLLTGYPKEWQVVGK
ncbi:Xaa-Pro dipeptidase [Marininema mesophilum]|uniref:Xaa-Pro dipeptidase n=1 Tax=Marininema mesophilum TaxID=1048340 RepID=A0A1H2UFV8_9BACL|nr:Xaa-Pro peptidase family protein [Marininema mesophilum]SDW54449.1 Xaa-Pro dipeptidase [Marininema mesophilum]